MPPRVEHPHPNFDELLAMAQDRLEPARVAKILARITNDAGEAPLLDAIFAYHEMRLEAAFEATRSCPLKATEHRIDAPQLLTPWLRPKRIQMVASSAGSQVHTLASPKRWIFGISTEVGPAKDCAWLTTSMKASVGLRYRFTVSAEGACYLASPSYEIVAGALRDCHRYLVPKWHHSVEGTTIQLHVEEY